MGTVPLARAGQRGDRATGDGSDCPHPTRNKNRATGTVPMARYGLGTIGTVPSVPGDWLWSRFEFEVRDFD